MAKKEKTGRRASKEDRARAAGLVASYFRGRSSPDSSYCINPEDEPELQMFGAVTDVETLIDALQSFAEHGTFALMSDIEPFLMRIEMSKLRSSGMTYEEAIAKLAEDYYTSSSTITRRVRRTVKT